MNEREIINHLASLVGGADSPIIQGIGDDCAVLEKDNNLVWLLTMDTLVDFVHFNRSWHRPELIGRKAVSVNVSDVAAMGGAPKCILLSVGMPQQFEPAWFEAFSQGVASACRQYGCLLAGGDTVHNPQGYSFTVTAIGETPKKQVVYRNGAQIGDDIWVTGNLGNAGAGLELCQRGFPVDQRYEALFQAHLDPVAQTEVGFQLGASGVVHAMMDISDGVATDLAHLCNRSKVQATLFSSQLPLSDELLEASAQLDLSPEQLALSGGEDYELLFTSSPQHASIIVEIAHQFKRNFFRVGRVERGRGVILVSADGKQRQVAYDGFDHFRKKT